MHFYDHEITRGLIHNRRKREHGLYWCSVSFIDCGDDTSQFNFPSALLLRVSANSLHLSIMRQHDYFVMPSIVLDGPLSP